ncbi:class I SAM-dependent methyltransferase [Streptococcus parauberis]|uniref:Methyltransferase domain protein n=1 Tax=Streptococcus parauberis NCFD 2020 TaxID=873447 RepID=F1Z0H7_9STRE|nr:class I SAM-dependent methyltransferase [Streptococcus parauberis]EGE54759.1 methyltransferase domain protein [Streptococcus parauberis NCFD 2020]
MSVNLESYKEMLAQPWGKIQYELTFVQLAHIKNQRVLDFGAGFGLTSQFLAKENEVIAIEPNEAVLDPQTPQAFQKILGSIEKVEELEAQSFDLIICHNVLEYVAPQERTTYLQALKRVLKPDGQLSIIKHNQAGKVMQAAVFENRIDKALGLLNGEDFESVSFTQGTTYSLEELLDASQMTLVKYQGLRCFYSLQPNAFKTGDNWFAEMTQLELAVCDLKPYKDISFLQHIWLKN